MREETVRTTTTVAMWASWTVATVGTFLRVTDHIPITWGAGVVLFIGTGIATGMARSRYRLRDAILGAFEAGIQAQRLQNRADLEKVAAESRKLNGLDVPPDAARRALADKIAEEVRRLGGH